MNSLCKNWINRSRSRDSKWIREFVLCICLPHSKTTLIVHDLYNNCDYIGNKTNKVSCYFLEMLKLHPIVEEILWSIFFMEKLCHQNAKGCIAHIYKQIRNEKLRKKERKKAGLKYKNSRLEMINKAGKCSKYKTDKSAFC